MAGYTKAEAELAFTQNQFTKLQENGNAAIYGSNIDPGYEFVVVWPNSRNMEWEDLEHHMNVMDIPGDIIDNIHSTLEDNQKKS